MQDAGESAKNAHDSSVERRTSMKELNVIPIRCQLPAVIEAPEEVWPKKTDSRPIREKRDQTIQRLYMTIAALVALCMIQWVAIYLMLPSVF